MKEETHGWRWTHRVDPSEVASLEVTDAHNQQAIKLSPWKTMTDEGYMSNVSVAMWDFP